MSSESAQNSFYAAERKFLHDLATPLTICKTWVKKVAKEMQEHPTEMDQAKAVERLQKAIEAIEKIEELHANFKEQIHRMESAS